MDRAPSNLATAGQRPGAYLSHVEGLRAVAALVVYVNHAYSQSWNPANNEYPQGWLSGITYSLAAGHMAVTVFIVISGFCLALPVVDAGSQIAGGVLAFLKRRARRILPAYYGALVLTLLLIATIIGEPTGSLWDDPIQFSRTAVVAHFLLLQDIFGTGQISYVFWSIAVEWHLYFVFPIIVWGIRRFGLTRTLLVALATGYCLYFGFHETRLVRAHPYYLGLFAFGLGAAYVTRSSRPDLVRWREFRGWPWIALACVLVVGVLCRVWGVHPARSRYHILDLPVGILAVSLLIWTSTVRESFLTRFLSWRPIVFVGTFSYSVYLIHAPLLQVVWQYTLRPFGIHGGVAFAILMTVGLGAILAAVYAFFWVCERPFLSRRVRPVREGGAAPAPA